MGYQVERDFQAPPDTRIRDYTPTEQGMRKERVQTQVDT
jgi:hypothetical protein